MSTTGSQLPKNTQKKNLMFEIAIGMSIVAIAFGLGVQTIPKIILNGTNSIAAVISGTLVDLTNTSRTRASVATLKISPILQKAAQMKADDMAQKGYFAHNSPEGLTPWYWLANAGYDYVYAGENLAIDFFESADVEKAWMNSPLHRENILNNAFTEIGIATAVGMYNGHQTTFVVQMFGRPVNSSSQISRNMIPKIIASTTDFVAASRQ
jgi:uncharacterized protein YkwD